MSRFEQKPTPVVYALIALAMAAVFVSDCFTPVGMADWVFYLLPLMLSLFVWQPIAPLGIAAMATLLTIIGHIISPPGTAPAIDRFNRGFGILTLWVIAVISFRYIRSKLILHKVNSDLQAEIAQRTQAEEARRASEQRLALAASGAQIGIFDYNIATGEVRATEQQARLLGLATTTAAVTTAAATTMLSQSYHSRQWAERIHVDDAKRVRTELRRAMKDHALYETECRIVWPDRSVHWISSRGMFHYDAAGQPQYMLGILMDITERKRTEEELQQAKAAAEQANRSKDQFLAILSHELRTPLTPVVMGVSMLQERTDLAPAVRESVDMIGRSVEMAVLLIDDLLDVSRITRGKIELRKQRVDVCTVMERAVEVCKPGIDARGLCFVMDKGAAAPYWVEADAARLQQVFWNLLKNAIKFTPHGGHVQIRCQLDREFVLIEVSDTGIGMEPDVQTRVFAAFEQAEREITRQFGGLGLGLTISKALVEMHGGEIEAQSEGRDKGATFRVRLPLIRAADLPVPGLSPEVPTHAAVPQSAVRPLSILLVEDHDVTAKLIRIALTSNGHIVETAGDIATALALAGQHSFDLLVSDLGLPDGSGHDLMRQLRDRGHTFPGIAMSGYGQEDDIQRSHQAGFAAHLIKPASRKAIAEAIASATTMPRKEVS
jgi:two-component system CheB/CheR fusion protein